MSESGLIIIIPLTMAIQHVYNEIYISFSKKIKRIFCSGIIGLVSVVVLIMYFCYSIKNYICVELALCTVGMIIICKLMEKLQTKLDLKEFNFYENMFIIPQMIFGAIIICFAFSKYMVTLCPESYSGKEIVLAKILYALWGSSEIMCNRLVFSRLFQKVKK